MSDSDAEAPSGPAARPPEFSCTATLWQVRDEGGWHFVTLPADWNEDLRLARPPGSGFGSIRVRAHIGDVRWETSLFPDTKRGAYLLPVKRTVRDRLGVGDGDEVQVHLTVLT